MPRQLFLNRRFSCRIVGLWRGSDRHRYKAIREWVNESYHAEYEFARYASKSDFVCHLPDQFRIVRADLTFCQSKFELIGMR